MARNLAIPALAGIALRNPVHHVKQGFLGHAGPIGGIISVVEMTASAPAAYLTRQFDDFLHAHVDEGGDATPLSVLSVLSRLGLDPWEEAANLARLPRASAAKRLIAFLEATPGASSTYLNASTVSDRLIDLLPSSASLEIHPVKLGIVRRWTKNATVIWPAAIAAILVLLLIVISR